MKTKDLKINFRYLGGNIACLSVDSIYGKIVHNDIDNEEAIIIFNSLIGEKENCQTVKTLLKENQELKKQLQIKHDGFMASTDELCEYAVENDKLKKQLEDMTDNYCSASKLKHERAIKIVMMNNQQKEFIKYLEDEIKFYKNRDSYMVADILGSYDLNNIELELLEEILQKYKEIIGD